MGVLSLDSKNRDAVTSLMPHYQAMARAVAFGGARIQDVAMRFGMNAHHVGVIMNSNLFRAEVARLQKMLEEGALDVNKELMLRVPRAIEVVDEELFQPVRSAARTKAAFEILDRTGYSKQRDPSKSGDTYNIVYLTPLPGESPVEARTRIDRIQKERALVESCKKAEIIDVIPGEPEAVEELSPEGLESILREE
jgi:hypothetical protein